MPNRVWGAVILAGWVTWQTAAVQADEGYFPLRDMTPVAPQAGWQDGGRQHADALPPPTDRGWVPEVGQPAPGLPQPPPRQWSSAPPVYEPRAAEWPGGREPAGSWQAPERLPPREPTVPAGPMPAGAGPAPGRPSGPAWRGDNRLFPEMPQSQAGEFGRSVPLPREHSRPPREEMGGGAVHGRLLNKGRPLVNCHVVLVPMHQEKGAYCFDSDRRVLSTTTGQDGVYYFEDAAAGEYKLTWLPEGQTRWIRRIAMRPDIKVRSGQATTAKEIRVALQTIN